MTAAPVMSSDITTSVPEPPLTSATFTSFTSVQALSSSTMSVTAPPASTSPTPTISTTNPQANTTQNRAVHPDTTLITTVTATTKVTAPTASTSPAPTINATNPQANTTQNQAASTDTTFTTTVTATTTAPSTTAPSPKCSYTVKPIKFGFQITITSSTNGSYMMNINEKGQPKSGKKLNHLNQTSSHEIKQLKPCRDDIKVTVGTGSCIPGSVCYQSDWNISSSLSTSNTNPPESCNTDDKTFCIKYNYSDICSDLTTTFTSGKCVNSTFKITKTIPLDLSEIKPEPLKELPAKINTTIPPKCDGVTVNYTCVEKEKPYQSKKLSELEPFTDYSCTGQINNNTDNIANTTAVDVRIDCDLQINIIKKKETNTSIDLSWTTTSKNCQDVLPTLEKLSYVCSCSPNPSKHHVPVEAKKEPAGRTCRVTGLEPFTNYTCNIQPTYNGNNVGEKKEVKQRTAIGIPEDIEKPTLSLPEHNVIKVTCVYKKKLNGPDKKFIARLSVNGQFQKELNSSKCDFEFKDLSYLTTYTVKLTAFNGKSESHPNGKDIKTSYNDKALIGFLVFLIIITSLALLFVIYKIYILKRRKSHDLGENMMLISTTNDEENLMPVEPIAAEMLLEAYKRKLADEGRLFLAEFQSVPRIFSRYTVKEAKKPCNTPKNRYVDILPYDYNRVTLSTGNGEAGCDYINASFIDGYKESKKYIAAQGPKDETVSDFWRMVWEQQSSIIVMVTRCEEGNRVKCAQYWPSQDRDTEIFGEFIVKLNSEDHCPDYTIRHLSLTNKREKNSEREVTHIQFMSWPDHGVPEEPHLLLKLRRRVNAFKNFFSGPIIVHCSAGVGRTGTYIGIDAMMEGLEAEGRVDIYAYVVRLRKQRCLMVQVEAQYILIHQALLEHNQFGETEITLPELHSTLSTLRQKNSDNEPTLLEDEFDRLPAFRNWRTFNTGITEENKKKNRSESVIPYDYNRVLLKIDEGHSRDSDPDEEEDEEEESSDEDEDSTKYINASHIAGYWGPRTFIAAQTPLPDTMADFWSMVYQKKASTIVMLSDCSEGEKESDCIYWDKEKKTFGELEVEVASTDISPTFITRNMLIRHVKRKESRPVKHFQFLKWSSGALPQKAQDLTDMIKEIQLSLGSGKAQRSMPVVAHCENGSARSGIFCALWNILDSAETEKLVDVFQVVKTLRKDRSGMFSSLEQYQFLYDALEGAFPVQNGDVKAVQAAAADSMQVVNETKAAEQPAEEKAEKAEQPASTTSNGQQGAAESAPLVADGEKGDKKEEPEQVSTETTPLEDTIVTVEA
ncbi:receptor-type tyrosine-protein phosphatase C [Symphorus nematophorus]